MKVLVACEFSDTVASAFRRLGHEAYSCDLVPSEGKSQFHIQADVLTVLDQGWDLMIAFPPCTYLARSGARWWAGNVVPQMMAVDFVWKLLRAPVPLIAVENPIGILSRLIRFPEQIVQPWQFGHGETKATCLWLKNLPRLRPTSVVPGRDHRIHRTGQAPSRSRERSRTYPGIAAAMAAQWGAAG